MQTLEIWRDIKGYEGSYQVSNLGIIKSLDREVQHTRGGLSRIKGRIIKQFACSSGYLKVSLSSNGKLKNLMTHQLVACSFLNHTPCGYELTVNHIDFDKINNNVENLELVTQRENGNQKHIKSSSKYVGVDWNKRSEKWREIGRAHV